MAKPTSTLEWCVVRLGEDHNWWVAETSDPVRWDVDGLSVVDPRQVAHLIELVDPLRDYGFNQDIFDAAFIPFRIERDLGSAKIRLKRVKESLFESDEKLFSLPDILDEENGPYADLLDHLTRCRVKLLNDLFAFESKLSVDEVEDEIREEQNAHFIEGRAIHSFEELSSILDFMPEGFDVDDEQPAKSVEDEADDISEPDAEEEEKLKNDESLKWDEDEEAESKGEEGKSKDKEDEDEDGEEEDDEKEEKEEKDEDDEEGEKSPKKSRGKR